MNKWSMDANELYYPNDVGKYVPVEKPLKLVQEQHGVRCTYKLVHEDNELLTYLHSFDGEPAMLNVVSQEWYQDGYHHKVDGPAIVKTDGSWSWYLYKKRHCLSGPAHYHAATDNYFWFVNGERVEKKWLIEMGIDPFNITEDDALILQMKFGFNDGES